MASSDDVRHRLYEQGLLKPPPLHGVGLTWVDRGRAYWVRRVGLTLMWLFATSITGLMAVVVTRGCVEGQRPLAVAAFTLVYGGLGAGMAFAAIRAIHVLDRYGHLGRTTRRSRRSHALGVRAASAFTALAQAFVLIAIPAAFGFCFPFFIRSFGRYTPGERFERRQIGLET
ncbi:hypothetical protein [Streptomyces morookaense]|uniref:Uncharacterized protein n=1 Tax=Streptomyces morookaense TaxID=1970 RepID=A0A7Y7EB36_STRMO|nr:hypothetical protein [Streptomyces morookaense]NVK82156.1 hypothetical protein [Streptomyces morookaense]GHF45711.1 hypothetical protein GCM10010359_55440 [Streptomyces morookaense]